MPRSTFECHCSQFTCNITVSKFVLYCCYCHFFLSISAGTSHDYAMDLQLTLEESTVKHMRKEKSVDSLINICLLQTGFKVVVSDSAAK